MSLARCLLLSLVVGGCTGSAPGASGAGGGCPNDLPQSCPPNAAGYAATVEPIFATSCVPCHRPGGTSVHLLQTYTQIFDLRGPVLDQVYACKMPPVDFPPLSPAQRADVLGWLSCGAPND